MKKVCCICGKEYHGYGNNPEPVMPMEMDGKENRCCEWCNWNVVINARLMISNLIRDAKEHSKPDESPFAFSKIPDTPAKKQ